ncbi:hypothetical protein LPB140_04690 [Sphingorhabdus lutea]|uniref:DUF1192 domain-containing protein n=1 Tax=Sphingorhabdus lutea TaxID=1913578 RepID=A0A1L3JAR7_9SPHN|nr:DUF1192 domain-containing protein [Sphingorhabdus lutea]APG62216.1 hypothetical protein LPB140_04690 [Sphingorhabdus lutea]
MDEDEFLRHDKSGALQKLILEDLDPLSQDELTIRIAILEKEILRCRDKKEKASDFRNIADAMFKKS